MNKENDEVIFSVKKIAAALHNSSKGTSSQASWVALLLAMTIPFGEIASIAISYELQQLITDN